MSNNNGNNGSNYGADLIKGLAPAIEIPQIGNLFQDTTQGLAEKLLDEFRTTYGIPETDKIIITPRLARNNTGVSDITVTVYFALDNASGNVYYKGKGNKGNKGNNGRINVLGVSGGSGTGQFGTSEKFNQVMKPLCKVSEKGKPIMNLKAVPGTHSVCSLELDFSSVMCIALGIKPNDAYDYLILQLTPVANTNNYTMLVVKYFSGNGSRKGKSSGINYARIEQDLFRRVNNNGGNGNNNGGRNY
jgi:hypothetical protein